MRAWTGLLVAVWFGAAFGAEATDRWAKAGALVPFTLTDQHDRPREVGPGLRLVLVSYDMDGGALVRDALEGASADTLTNAGAVYIANIGRMPGFVTRLFALPRMRKRPYPVLLDADGRITASLVGKEGEAVAVRCAGGRIIAIEPLGSVAAVRQVLGLP